MAKNIYEATGDNDWDKVSDNQEESNNKEEQEDKILVANGDGFDEVDRKEYEKTIPNYNSSPLNQSNVSANQAESKGYVPGEYYDYLQKIIDDNRNKQKQEEIERDERNTKRGKLVSSISDAARALSNVFFANKYAPNMYDESSATSTKYDAKMEEAKNKRKESDGLYQNALDKMAALKRDERLFSLQEEQKREAMRLKAEDTKAKLEYYQAQIDKLEAEGDTEGARQLYYKALATYNDAKADNQRIQAEWAPKINQGKLNEYNTRSEANKARATASYASADASSARAAKTRNSTTGNTDKKNSYTNTQNWFSYGK
ncbi:MAG: hypothetical protein ACI4XS_07470 [Bacillus sp. (in: firmicutes)]